MTRPSRPGIRRAASWMLMILQGLFAVLHLFPSLAYRVGAGATTTVIVAHINELGPIWVGSFGITALLLLHALIWNKGRQIYLWHLLAGAVFGGYTAALFVGALGDSPHGPVTYPVLALLPIIGNVLLALSYAGGDR